MTTEQVKQIKFFAFEALRRDAGVCIACGLCQTRTKVVFGVGNPNSPLMLIGEGPGANEDATGEPFVGRAGKLLDQCLYEAGMKRHHIYITNIVKCRASEIEKGRIKNRAPTHEEIDTCVPLWLEKQIEIMQPLVIVCIGSPSASTVIQKNFRIMADRGKFLESKYCRNTIAALHPAFILRQEGERYVSTRQTLIDDLKAAKDKAIAARSEAKLTLF